MRISLQEYAANLNHCKEGCSIICIPYRDTTLLSGELRIILYHRHVANPLNPVGLSTAIAEFTPAFFRRACLRSTTEKEISVYDSLLHFQIHNAINWK
jgi:hypothetical protein